MADPTFKDLAPWMGTIMAFGAMLIGFGKLRASVAMKEDVSEEIEKAVDDAVEECSERCEFQKTSCQTEVAQKINGVERMVQSVDKKTDEIKDGFEKAVEKIQILVIDLHEKQSKRIEDMDSKRERAKDDMNQKFQDMSEGVQRSIGRLEGLIKNGSR